MAFQVAAAIASAPVTGICDLSNDLGASRHRPGIMNVSVFDNDVGGLGLDTTEFIRLLDPLSIFVVTDGAQHHHPVTPGELGVSDGAVLFGHHQVLFESKCLTEPFYRRW